VKKILIIGIVVVLVVMATVWMIFSLKSKPKTQARMLYKQSLELIEEGRIKEASANLEKIAGEFGDSKIISRAFLDAAKLKIEEGKLVEAREILKMAVAFSPVSGVFDEVRENLWDINMKILFSPIITKETTVYEVKKGDTIYKIAKEFNTTVELISKSNRIKNSTIRPGDKLKIANKEFNVVVDKSKNLLTLKEEEDVIKVYTVSTGANNSTPVGKFEITNKLKDPVWYKSGAVVAAESPDNILGSRWLGLSVKDYGIHGTTQPESIGKQVTHGCVRMRNNEVEELYSILPVGAKVVIVD